MNRNFISANPFISNFCLCPMHDVGHRVSSSRRWNLQRQSIIKYSVRHSCVSQVCVEFDLVAVYFHRLNCISSPGRMALQYSSVEDQTQRKLSATDLFSQVNLFRLCMTQETSPSFLPNENDKRAILYQ